MEIKRYEMGPKGLIPIDVAANSIKNNLAPGAVLHWGGNMAWPAQDYAVIRRIEDSRGNGDVYYDLISLESFGEQRTEAYGIKSESDPSVWHGQHMFLTSQVLSADEVLDLIERNKVKKLADEATKNQASDAFAKECDRLRSLDNGLVRSSDKLSGHVLAAKNIKKELATLWPSVKFSVRSKSYSGGDSITVGWTDGPTSAQVDRILNKYEGGSFDGMTDSYTYSRSPWTAVYGDTKYAHGSRRYSKALLERAIAESQAVGCSIIEGSTDCWIECADHNERQRAQHKIGEIDATEGK